MQPMIANFALANLMASLTVAVAYVVLLPFERSQPGNRSDNKAAGR